MNNVFVERERILDSQPSHHGKRNAVGKADLETREPFEPMDGVNLILLSGSQDLHVT